MPFNRAFAEFFSYAWPFVFFCRSDFLAQKIRLEFQRSRTPHNSEGNMNNGSDIQKLFKSRAERQEQRVGSSAQGARVTFGRSHASSDC